MDIRNVADSGRKKQALGNRQKLVSIVKTVIFCGRQGLALRGHREVGHVMEEPDENDGNFRALLRFRMDAGDVILREHLLNASHNATYISPRIQNEIIEGIGKIFRKKIAAEVRQSGFFTILADETRDASKTDQLTLCLRYVTSKDDQKAITEKFLMFCEIPDRTGRGLARQILETLKAENIDVTKMRGQGYDGCSAMSGEFKGVQAVIKDSIPEALYLHCASHCLNLVIAHATKNGVIRNTVSTIGNVCAFITRSTGRIAILEEKVMLLFDSSKARRLKPLCTTRWVESHKAFITFKEMFVPIVATMKEISAKAKGDDASRAYELLSAICKCEFVAALLVIESFSSLMLPLSITLQSPELDLLSALVRHSYGTV